jgi:hypothetical protein
MTPTAHPGNDFAAMAFSRMLIAAGKRSDALISDWSREVGSAVMAAMHSNANQNQGKLSVIFSSFLPAWEAILDCARVVYQTSYMEWRFDC